MYLLKKYLQKAKSTCAVCLAFYLACPGNASAQTWDGLNHAQQGMALARSAQDAYKKRRIQFLGRNFRSDCSGFIQGILWDQGHDLDAFYRIYKHKLNGVALIQKYAERVGRFGKDIKPQKGDLVFFNRTYDKNKDGLRNDRLTHIGIVVRVDKNRTVTFLHHMQGHVQKGYMNLKRPQKHKKETHILNTPLTRHPASLAAQLFEGFGHI